MKGVFSHARGQILGIFCQGPLTPLSSIAVLGCYLFWFPSVVKFVLCPFSVKSAYFSFFPLIGIKNYYCFMYKWFTSNTKKEIKPSQCMLVSDRGLWSSNHHPCFQEVRSYITAMTSHMRWEKNIQVISNMPLICLHMLLLLISIFYFIIISICDGLFISMWHVLLTPTLAFW